jgi:phosphohistidine phosphatase
MDLYIVRHAIAVERGSPAFPWDDDRPLTPEGMHKFRLVARGLARLDVQVERILASPLIRAQQTAKILRDALSPDLDIDNTPHLKPGAGYADSLAAVTSLDAKSVAIVGHEPHLSGFASYLLAGPGASAALAFRKGAAAYIRFPEEIAPGQGMLEWLIQPGALRRLADS